MGVRSERPMPGMDDNQPPKTMLAMVPTRTNRVRAMLRDDLGEVGRLFNISFRGSDRPADADFRSYVEKLFFGSPRYSPEQGSIVHQSGAGLDAALLVLPMGFLIGDRRITGRLLCAFMSNGQKSGTHGAARLSRHLGASNAEFYFSDNASPQSADHWTTGNGVVMGVQSMEWRREFRPLDAMALRAARHQRLFGGRMVRGALSPLDRMVRHRIPSLVPVTPDGVEVVASDMTAFIRHAEPMTRRFALRPAWDEREIGWMLELAGSNVTLGTLRCVEMRRGGAVIGCVLYYAKPEAVAIVMNVLTAAGSEADVMAALFSHLDAEGCTAARGMAQPFLLAALLRQRRVSLRYGGFFCAKTEDVAVAEAIRRNDVYVGGVASESWSRLLTDFQ